MWGVLKQLRVLAGAVMGGGTLSALALAGLVAFGAVTYSKGRASAQQECRAAELERVVAGQRAALDRLHQQLARAEAMRSEVQAQAARDAEIYQSEREDADAYKKELAARADNCPISADDAERLRRLGG